MRKCTKCGQFSYVDHPLCANRKGVPKFVTEKVVRERVMTAKRLKQKCQAKRIPMARVFRLIHYSPTAYTSFMIGQAHESRYQQFEQTIDSL